MNVLPILGQSPLSLEQFKIDEYRNGLLKEDGTLLVQEIHQVLSPKECSKLIQFAHETGFEKPNFGKARVCERLHTVNEDLSALVIDRLRRFLPEIIVIDDVKWRLSRFTHHWRYVHYTPGGHFSPHYDGSKMLPWKEMSVFTVQFYLNDNFSGGSTRFYMDYEPNRKAPHLVEYGKVEEFNPGQPTHEVKPEAGKVLVFNHTENVLHDGEPVLEGEKYILRGDILYSACEEDYEKLENSSVPAEQRMWSNEAAQRGDTKSYIGEVWHCQCGDDLCGVKEISSPSDEAKKNSPMRVILISGKRAAGKDFVATKIQKSFEKLHMKVHRTSLGILNKKIYADRYGLDVNRLEQDREFKENHRQAMIMQHTMMDVHNPDWAVKQVVQNAENEKADVLIVSDIRRLKDLEWFLKNSEAAPSLIRINADEEARLQRGWDPDPIKDSLPTEVELDDYQAWTASFDNSDMSNESERKTDEWIQSSVILPAVLDSSRLNKR